MAPRPSLCPGPCLTSAQVLSREPRALRCFPPAPGSRQPRPLHLRLQGAVHPEPELRVPPFTLRPSPTPPTGSKTALPPTCVLSRAGGRIFSRWRGVLSLAMAASVLKRILAGLGCAQAKGGEGSAPEP